MTQMMKAAIYQNYGGPEVVQVTDVAKPAPKPDQVLIRVHATTVSTADWRARSLAMPAGFALFGRPAFGLFGPRQKILGSDFSGEIEAVGGQVTTFKPGDEVFGSTGMKLGAHAEYLTVKANGLIAPKPANLTFEQAAAIPFGGMTALDFLKYKANLATGEQVLILSASGCVGSAAVQIAKYYGAKVTGITGTANVDRVRDLGADWVIDYKQQNFHQGSDRYDIILDTTGTIAYRDVAHLLNPNGRVLLLLASLWQNLGLGRPPKGSRHTAIKGIAKERPEDIATLGAMASEGRLTPLIDSTYAFDDIAKAHARVETGHKVGSVVVSLL